MPELTDAELSELAAIHAPGDPEQPWCLSEPAESWPCDAARLLASLRASRAREAQLETIAKEAWRFWSDITSGAPPMPDRGYSVIRVHPQRLAAFDALFRSSAVLADEPAAVGEGT